jgi:hypothetical protein
MRILISLGFFVASTASAYAVSVVPEIDAGSGRAALGVLGSIGALIWERRSKRRS